MSLLKADYQQILRHIKFLKTQPWLTESQKFWPKYLFHFTHIENAKNILMEECLYSRRHLKNENKPLTDIASPEIIEKTSDERRDFVRLYFRPRTPTQFSNEGFRQKNKLRYDAHCPVPVFFLFAADEILKMKSTSFSNGNLGSSKAEISDTVDFYKSLPFKEIYHDASLYRFSDEERKKVTFHRHAEALIPKSLDLSALKHIVCRSQAELETLLTILPGPVRSKWRNCIKRDKYAFFFFRRWVYLEKVSMTPESVIFNFSPDAAPALFDAKIVVEEFQTGKKHFWEDSRFEPKAPLELKLAKFSGPRRYKVTFSLDDHLAYQGCFEDSETLF
ncbi:MAG: DUF4433 domain-containing protein [bacterium]|nr:DUF4433 domain-containing protein [bacterium]